MFYGIWMKMQCVCVCLSISQHKAKLFLVKVCSENVDKICIASLGNDSEHLIDTHSTCITRQGQGFGGFGSCISYSFSQISISTLNVESTQYLQSARRSYRHRKWFFDVRTCRIQESLLLSFIRVKRWTRESYLGTRPNHIQ